MEHSGDVMGAVAHHDVLQFSLPGGDFLQAIPGAELQGADLADAIWHKCLHAFFHALVGEHARQLGQLFIQGQLRQQQLRPLPGRIFRVHIILHIHTLHILYSNSSKVH